MSSRAIAPKLDLGAWSWAVFEGARNPYILLCTIYVFAPYVAMVLIGDPVRGQEVISGWHKATGLMVALTAPLIGAAADGAGRRKPLLAAIVCVMAPAIFIQWWATPNGLGVHGAGAAIIVAGLCFAWTEVLHNSMLKAACPPNAVSFVSGLGLALGNLASVLLLVLVLVTLALPGQVDWPFIPQAPLFNLDAAMHEPSRAVAPISAVWFAILSLPLFLFTRDTTATGMSLARALRTSGARIFNTIRGLRSRRPIALFLLARMLYVDGTTAIIIFSGVYAAGVMSWGMLEMLAYGVLLSIFAAFGGLFGPWLDHALGAKRAVMAEIAVTLVCLLAMCSTAPDTILLMAAAEAPVWAGPIFATAPEIFYLCISLIIAMSITASYGSSRTLMSALAPPGMEGELFGLYALASSATAWLGPLLVESFTRSFDSQAAGFASVSILLVAGFALLAWVRPPIRDGGA